MEELFAADKLQVHRRAVSYAGLGCSGGPPQGARSIYLIALALHALAQQLAIASDRFGFFARPPFRRLLVIAPQLHFSEYSFALHFLLQGSQSLIDIIIANENLHGSVSPSMGMHLGPTTRPAKCANI